MSWTPAEEPSCTGEARDVIELLIEGRPRDLGGFSVRRVLPSASRRTVGPFIFFDHMGPAQLPPGQGFDVRPHPHIGLSTVTYLFSGELDHRDSLGTHRTIRPGELNWMTAGRGIVHSERSSAAARVSGAHMHGIQAWVALPKAHEETEPSFVHHDAHELPVVDTGAARVTVIAGEVLGARSPVVTHSELFYADALLADGATLEPPLHVDERGAYVAEGEVTLAGERFGPGNLVVFRRGQRCAMRAEGRARVMLLGGAPLDGPRLIYWNFVSSSAERLERAKEDWRAMRFGTIPGDDREFIPLPP